MLCKILVDIVKDKSLYVGTIWIVALITLNQSTKYTYNKCGIR